MRDDTDRSQDGKDPSARRLRLVHPSAPPKPRLKTYRRRGVTFTPEESSRIRAALRNARTLFGSWSCLADALYLHPNTPEDVANGHATPSGDLVVRLAKALGVPVDSLYAAPRSAEKCPHCGRGGAP